MSNNLDLRRGLNIPISGEAELKVTKKVVPDEVALKPTDFKGLIPRLLVKEGDPVKAGSPVYCDKQNPELLFTSPVSGVVKKISRGDKRKLLAIVISPDAQQESISFKVPEKLDEKALRELLLSSGLWPFIVQRPYGVMAATSGVRPKAIFISSFSTAPLAPDTDFTLGDSFADIQRAVDALALLSDGGVHFSVSAKAYSKSPFHKIENAVLHVVDGPHPAGNVGVQISHISPILKGETVWTVSMEGAAAIGRLLRTGHVDLWRKVAVTGPMAPTPAYVQALPGTPVRQMVAAAPGARVIGGDVLSGNVIDRNGYLGFFDNQLTLLCEGTDREILGWAKPFRFGVHSSSMCYFSWLLPWKKYDMDTNLHGGPRAFVETKCFEDVTPMDIFPIYLIKACLAGDIEKMEKFGIYEVLPEDLALCDYVDPSKNDIQAIIASGIDLMIKEM